MQDQITSKGIEIESSPERLKKVRKFIAGACRDANLSEEVTEHVVQASDEAVTNIVNHARSSDDHGKVEVNIDITPVRLRIIIRDHTNGSSLDFCGEQGAPVEEEGRHKLGIFLIQQIMDEIKYTFKKGFQNDLEMIRFLQK